MTKIAAADRWIIERIAEPAAWRLSRWLSPFSVARLLLVTFVAGWIAQSMSGGVINVTVAVAVVMFAPLRMWVLGRLENNVTKSGLNEERWMDWLAALRCLLMVSNAMGLLLAALTWTVTPMEVANLSYLLHLYFSACNRPPPQPQTYSRLATEGAQG